MQPGSGVDGVPDTAGMRAYADELEKRFHRLQEDGPMLARRARAVQVTQKSVDGLITATVGARGELIRLDIDPRIYRRPDARALADTIVETVTKARTRAQQEVVELFASLVPREQMQAQLNGDQEALTEILHRQMRGEG